MARETRPAVQRAASGGTLAPRAGGVGKRSLTQSLEGGGGGVGGTRISERDRLIQRVIDNASSNPLYAKQALGQLRTRFADDAEAIEFVERAEPMFEEEEGKVEQEEQENAEQENAEQENADSVDADGVDERENAERENAEQETAESMEAVSAVVAESSDTTQETESEETGGGQTKETSKKPVKWLSIVVPLPADVQQLIRQVRAQKRPSTLLLRDRLVKLLVQVAVPTDPSNAARIADLYQTYLKDTDKVLLDGLVRRRPGKGAVYEPVTRHGFKFTDEMLRDWRSAAGVRERTPTPTPTPSLTSGNETSVGDALQWIWDLLKGDFNENPDAVQTVLNGVFGLIPGIDQALDGRDIIANLYALIGQRRYDEFDPWFNLVVTLIGAVPEIGSVIKTIIKLVKRGASKLPLDEVLGLVKTIDAGDALDTVKGYLDDLLGGIAGLGASVLSRAQSILGGAVRGLEQLVGMAKAISTTATAHLTRLLDAARATLARAAGKIQQVMDLIATKCRELLDAIAARITKLRKQDDLSITPKDTPDVPSTKPDPTRKTDASKKQRDESTITPKSNTKTDTKSNPDTEAKPEVEEPKTSKSELSEERQRIRDNFLKKYPGGKATAYRGIRLAPEETFVGINPGKPQMVTTLGDEDAALTYALTAPNRARPNTGTDRVVIMKMEITWEHIVHDPYEVIEHVFLDPALDVTTLPGFKKIELTLEQAKSPGALQRIMTALQ
jgi:hypothetical protein